MLGEPDAETALKAELKLFEDDLIARIVSGGDHESIGTPSHAYTMRLLMFHYSKLNTQKSREHFITNVLRILRKAVLESSKNLTTAGFLDFELDLELKHLEQPYTLLSYAVSWAQAQLLELKVARMSENKVSLKTITLAYILLLENGILPSDEAYDGKAQTRDFAKYVAKSINKKGLPASPSGVYNYMNITNNKSKFFINTHSNFKAALAWIMQVWPRIDITNIKPLARMEKL